MIRRLLLGGIACLLAIPIHAQDIRGTVKDLGAVTVDNALHNPTWLNLAQARIESKWTLSEAVRLQADGRALLRTTSAGTDDDARIDRLHLSLRKGPVEAHVGRQRINWGKTMVWNPNDVFNAYAFLDVDEEVRPSTDAVLTQVGWGVNSAVEVGATTDVAAALFRGSLGTYDIQVLAARYKEQWVLGGGWSGYVGGSGFKGEGSWFTGDGTVSLSLGADHMLANGVYLNAEVLRNGGFDGTGGAFGLLATPPSPENLFPAPSAYMLGAGSAVHPLFSLNLAVVGAITRDLTVVMPQATVSLAENLDLLVMGQILRSWESNSLFLRLRWAF